MVTLYFFQLVELIHLAKIFNEKLKYFKYLNKGVRNKEMLEVERIERLLTFNHQYSQGI